MILARPEGGIGVSRTHSTSSTIRTDNAVQNLYLEAYSKGFGKSRNLHAKTHGTNFILVIPPVKLYHTFP